MKNSSTICFAISIFLFTAFGCIRNDSIPKGNNFKIPKITGSGEKEIIFESKNLPLYSKRNLQTLMLGKNKIEIQEIMGRPEGRSLDGGNGYLWDYRRPIFDESTEKVFEWSLVSFKFIGGLCSSINIRLEDPPTFLLRTNLKETNQTTDSF